MNRRLPPRLRMSLVGFALYSLYAPAHAEEARTAAAVVVTANPLGSDLFDMASPVSVMDERELMLHRGSTLGETVGQLPGVSSTSFGPNASRPVIRGLDGDRVRIMNNGGASIDASSLSFDHAVTIDPLAVERIEVVRGPAALLYGGSAIGGVVNTIDNRIPVSSVSRPTGRIEGALGGADSQRALSALFEVGHNGLNLHADGFTRRSSDLRMPDWRGPSRLANSAADTDGASLGSSYTWADGYLGVSWASYNSLYGTVAEPGVSIDMQSSRLDAAGELRNLGGWLNSAKFRIGHTDYKHTELDEGTPATRFKNRGTDGRVELTHARTAGFIGAFGAQFDDTDFSALGDEAFVPEAKTRTRAVFVFEETDIERFKLNFGGRIEHSELDSEGGARFGAPQSRQFNAGSASAGAVYSFSEQLSLATSLAHTERAPTYYELFANGPHAATGNYEVGSTDVDKEKSNSLDVQLRLRHGPHSATLGVFHSRFQNFIALGGSGRMRGADGEIDPLDANGDGVADGSGEDILPEFSFHGVPASFSGLEAQGRFLLHEGAGKTHLETRFDYVRAKNRDTGSPLPRITPMRLTLALEYQTDALGARLEMVNALRQHRTDDAESETAGYTLLNAALNYRLSTGPMSWDAYLRANNLFDRLARNHVSFLKDMAPFAGRGVMAGLRASF